MRGSSLASHVRSVIVLVSLFPCVRAADGAVFHLRDGNHVTGAYVGETKENLIFIDTDGKRHTVALDDVLGVDWEDGDDRALRARAEKERAKWLEERQREATRTMEGLASKEAEVADAALAKLSGYRKNELLPALIQGVRSPAGPVREFALRELTGVEDPSAAVPIALGALVADDREFALRAHDAAVAKEPELARRVYETIAVRSSTKLEYRTKALERLGAIADRRSIPLLLEQIHYMQSDIRLTMLRSKGFKEVTVNLGSLQQAANQVQIELPQAELISVNTSAVVPIAKLQVLEGRMFATLAEISRQDFGSDLAAWRDWWAQESKQEARPAPGNSRGATSAPPSG
ncbi:MAG: hypothetical protein L0Z55_13230 [Planctomycetes bacterium]|nr:hypothetical protein [Planctomycetota bacterium]